MSEENIAFRLKFLIGNLGLSSSQFADKCGITRPTLSQLLTGRNKKISNLIIEQIHAKYPALSVGWLLFGEGDMWTSQENLNNAGTITNQGKDNDAGESSPPEGQKNGSQNPEIPPLGQQSATEAKENGVIAHQNASVNSNNENINDCLKTIDLLNKIEKNQVKPRKVVQVTIYYDDSTFQTLYPK